MATVPIQVPDEVCGPAMLALQDRPRAFAYLMGGGERSRSKAAREAGYSDHKGAAHVQAHMLMQRADVLAAIREVSSRLLQGLAPLALGAMRAILEDSKHPAHARMIETVLDRTGYAAKTEHKVTVEHTADLKQLEDFARRLAVEAGKPAEFFLSGPRVLEGEVVKDMAP